MKYVFYIAVGLVVVALLYFGIFTREQAQQSVNTVQDNWETKTDEQPPLIVKVTPVELGTDTASWRFNIIFDTHSGSLDDDMLAVATLADDKNTAYQPTAWEGPRPGGHHREGMLVFEAINPIPAFVELKIRNVGGVPERLFKWDMK